MAVYIPTLHSKIRYYERVEEDYSRRDTVIEFSLSWGDIEIFPYTPEEYKKVLELRKAKEHDC